MVHAVDWQLRTTPPHLARSWREVGWWRDESLGQLLSARLGAHPALAFAVRSQVRPWRGTWRDVDLMARRLAAGLRARGVGAGDAVAFQLPNWVEAAAAFYAAAYLGATVVPIVHFYGLREVGFILRRTGVRALVTSDRFGHVDHLAVLEELWPDLPELQIVVVVGDRVPVDAERFEDVIDADPIHRPAAVDPDTPALIAYTSGTTADPKGVIHSHRTIGCEVRQLAGMQPGGGVPTLVGAPVGHGIGMLAALLVPVEQGRPIHLIDVWEPATVLRAMVAEGLVAGAGATFFLTSLLDHPDFGPEHLRLMSHIGLGGSAVPSAVTERVTDLGISVVRMYGSTEHPSTTGCTHDAPAAKRLYTDGRPLAGCEVRLVDDAGAESASGQPGEILSRGPDCCMGYTDPALTAEAFDDDGWFATGDVGVLDADGYLTVVDRKKDIIIRGGENVSALEVEEQVLRISGVAEVAVVAAPDDRLGEHGSAFVRLAAGGHPFELAALRDHLRDAGLARPKWPEELRFVDDFPRTASGKVQKFVLRERLRLR